MREALLVLADGTTFRGGAFGAEAEVFGEVVFNTGLTGYQEVLTDPSYHGQLVTMTYPHQGNYGLNDLDAEADRPWVRGFIVREVTQRPSSWRSTGDLDSYLRHNGIAGISGIDTRRLTRRLRQEGAMTGGLSTLDTDEASLLDRVRAAPAIIGQDLVQDVTPSSAYDANGEELIASGLLDPGAGETDPRIEGARVAAIDLGMKRNILRCLAGRGFAVRVFPASTPAAMLLAWSPDAVFVSNGPGDPRALGYAVDSLREVVSAGVPTFGICLGHQILGQALGAGIDKLKFGHRGANHPVKSLENGRVEITTHNHGFAVTTDLDPAADGAAWQRLAATTADDWVWSSALGDVALTHFDLNDGTLEGMRCRDVPAFSVQYHPEAAPGPHDSRYLFGGFADLVAAN